MATFEQLGNSIKEECIFVDYYPLGLHEEEVVTVTEEEIQDFDDNITSGTVLVIKSEETDDEDKGQDDEEFTEAQISVEDSSPVESVSSPLENKSSSPSENKLLKTHRCDHCNRLFATHEKMIRHVRMYHGENVEVKLDNEGKRHWVCGSCNKTFVSRKGSIIHQRTHTGERPYQCNVCSKRFIDSSTLMKHHVIHQAVRPFMCHICQRGFNQKVALQRHERTHSQQQVVYICKYCPKTFLVPSSLQAHEKLHSGIKPYSCSYCPSSFHTSTAQRQHERVHTNERPYRCLHCPKAFKDSGTLFKHQFVHSGVKPFICPLCTQGFTQKVALKKHIKSHTTKATSMVCLLCNDVNSKSKDELYSHFLQHVMVDRKSTRRGERKNMVLNNVELMKSTSTVDSIELKQPLSESDLTDLTTLCDVAISTSRNFNFNVSKDVHINNNNNNTNKTNSNRSLPKDYQYHCSECGLGFKRIKSLKAHLQGHSLSCKRCDKVYSDRTLLEEHEKLFCNNVSVSVANVSCKLNGRKRLGKGKPTGKVRTVVKRQYFCECCDKQFSSRNGYMIHQRSHTGERPYACRWCEKAFGDSATRHKHERIHTGERPFKCMHCPRAFNQRAALRAHQVTHSVDRAFVCPFCPSSFPYAATLKRHFDTCHRDRAIVMCPVCGQSPMTTDDLHVHIISNHVSPGKESTCPLCDSGTFPSSDEFADHLVWHAKQVVPNNNNTKKMLNATKPQRVLSAVAFLTESAMKKVNVKC